MEQQSSDSTNDAPKILRSFHDFLNPGKSTSDSTSESVAVVIDGLRKTPGLDLSSTDEEVPHDLAPDPFSLSKLPDKAPSGSDADLNYTTSAEDSNISEGRPEVELFQRLYLAFCLKSSVKQDTDEASKAAQLFTEALAGCLDKMKSSDKIAEFFKSRGNQAMQSKQYAEAVELYTEALSIAAAYIQLNKNLEAIKDCLNAIQIDPKYSKAYNRLGSAYFALGEYNQALDKGFLRALKLDPDNQTAQQNIRLTRCKLNEKQQENIHELCNPGEVSSFSNGGNSVNPGGNSVNPEFLSDYIKGLLYLSQQRTHSEDPIGDLAEVFLRRRRESNSDSDDSSEDKSEDLPEVNLSDFFISAAQILSQLGSPHGAGAANPAHQAN